MRIVCIAVLCATIWRTAFGLFVDEFGLQLALLKQIVKLEAKNVSVQHRSLAIYYLDKVQMENSPDVVENNVKLFASAVSSHDEKADHQALYIFCVVGGAKNPLSKLLPFDAPNALFIGLSNVHYDLLAHIHTISVLGDNTVSKFDSIFFLNQDARGPFEDRLHGKWWQRIVSVFQQNPTVGIVGPMISCEISPHVQTHAFAMRPEVALEVFHEFNPRRIAGKRNKNRHIETSISEEVVNLGHSLTSLYYQRYFNRTIFTGDCVVREGNNAFHRSNPTSWCNVSPEDALFMRFGGAPLRIKGYYCQDTLKLIAQATEQIALAEPALQLIVPETIYGGHFYALHKEYNAEIWKDRTASPLSTSANEKNDNNVCLLVRTYGMHGQAALNNTRVVGTGLKQLIQSKFSYACDCCMFFHPHFANFPLSFSKPQLNNFFALHDRSAQTKYTKLGGFFLCHRRSAFRSRTSVHTQRL